VGLRQGALEGLVTVSAGPNRAVLVTGHTGFKGGWLSLWLAQLGADVHGYALEPPTTPSFFETAKVAASLASDARADLADLARLKETIARVKPVVVFHLAAQPLVRASYRDPIGTFATNVMGTANVLEAARHAPTVKAVVLITTDKVYENREQPDHAYAERDPLGGHDPYSGSKAAAEIVAESYRKSFFANGARVATARAGNVIGGGDWAEDRLVPDCLRAFERGEAVRLRNPNAVRPWQHVLEPLSGYMRLAERLVSNDGAAFAGPWNFGPEASDDASVGDVAEMTAKSWGGSARVERAPSADNPHEAGFLRLDNAKAKQQLRWTPRWSLHDALERTVAWHRAWRDGSDMHAFSLSQIRDYEAGK
jgi:CDP-glucose 4,6-dehydratase